MKGKNRFTWLEASVTGFFLSYSAMACLVTAFDFPGVSLWVLALCCVFSALLWGICCAGRLGLIPLGLLAVAAGFLWQSGMLEQGLESLLYKISRVYHDAYKWQIIRWSWRDVQQMDQTLPPFLYLMGGLLAALTAWTVCRGQSSIVACFPACLPLFCCFVVTDSVPDTVWLVCFLTCLLVMMLTSSTRQEDPVQGRRLAAFVAVPALVAVCMLFLAIPSRTYYRQAQAQAIRDTILGKNTLEQMLEKLSDKAAGFVELSSGKVDLSAVGPRRDSQNQILEVTTRLHGGTVYLRSTALDRYTGTAWQDSGMALPDLYWPSPEGMRPVGEVQIKTQYAHEMLYLPYYTQGMDLSQLTRGAQNTKKLNEYSLACVVPDGSVYSYVTGSTVSAAARVQMESGSRLSEDTRQWAMPLAQSIVADQKDPYYQALLIAEYVKNSARYDQNTSQMPSNHKDFAQWFLEESDTGYCVHFASAGAVLLKALGIPARYVTGYMVQTKAGTPQEVLSSDAHAWVEYWLPGFGWTVLECTPASVQTGGEDVTRPSEEQPTQSIPETLPQTPGQSGPATKPAPPVRLDKWLIALAVILLLTAAFLGQRQLRLRQRRKARHRGSTNAQILAHWEEAQRLCSRLGTTPEEALLELAEMAKFSPYTLTEQELERFDAFLDTARQQLRRKPLLRRFWDKWILALY